MKTILLGKVPPPAKPWWIGLHVTCGYCATVVELEQADDVMTGSDRCPNGKRWLSVKCPVCNVLIEFTQSNERVAESDKR